MATSFKISKDILDDNISGMNTLVVPNTNTFPAVNQPGNIVYKTNTFYGQGSTSWIPFAGIGTVDGILAFDTTPIVYSVGGGGATSIYFGGTTGIGAFQIGVFNNLFFTASKKGIYNVTTRMQVEPDDPFVVFIGINGNFIVLGTYVEYSINGLYSMSVNLPLNVGDSISVRKIGFGTVNSRYFSVCLIKEIA